jgi:hypothetical protein
MTKDEALKMAIEWFDMAEMDISHHAYNSALPIIQACKEALAHKSLGDFKSISKEECVDYIEYLRKQIDLLIFKEQPEQEQPKEWVGLSDEEIFALCPYIDHDLLEEAFYRGARATEAKLKELNT